MPSTVSVAAKKCAKLPKLEIPRFDGNMLGWQSFWEQFEIIVHKDDELTNPERLVYLQQALKGGSAMNAMISMAKPSNI